MLKNQKGFTLIELVMIIVILAYSGSGNTRYIDLRSDSRYVTARGVLGSIRASIQ